MFKLNQRSFSIDTNIQIHVDSKNTLIDQVIVFITCLIYAHQSEWVFELCVALVIVMTNWFPQHTIYAFTRNFISIRNSFFISRPTVYCSYG